MSLETFKSQLNDVVKNGSVVDFGVPINRTNALPLDLSSIIILGDLNFDDYDTDNFKDLAGKAALADPNSYPGQIKTVIGKVAGQIKAISLVLQADGASVKVLAYQDSVDTLTQSLVNEIEKTDVIQEDLTKIQGQISGFNTKFNEIDALHETIGNLTSIMNFRGVFKEFSLAPTSPESGDVIVISREPGYEAQDTSINGMEYIWNAEASRWVELGFGSNIALFIGGNAGLTVPPKLLSGQYTHSHTDLISYYNAALEKLVELIGLIPDETKDYISFKVKLDEGTPVILGAKNLADYLSQFITAKTDTIREELRRDINTELDDMVATAMNNAKAEFIQTDAELDRKITRVRVEAKTDLKTEIDNTNETIANLIHLTEPDESGYSILKINLPTYP